MALSSKAKRRQKLLRAFGARCYWCAGKMDIPPHGESDESFGRNPEGATIEHHIQKEKGTVIDMHLRLAHKRCNR